MKGFLRYIVTIIVLAFLLFAGVFLGITYQKKGVYDSAYQSVIVDKYRLLQNTDEKKIIMIAGSSSSFGLAAITVTFFPL